MELKLLLVVALVASTQAGPIDSVRDSCSQSCPSTNKFGYRPGKSYEFDYNVKTSTSVKGASEGLSNMELTAKVHVEALSKCDFILRVEDVRLHETDPTNYENKILSAGSEELRNVLERHDLRFSFQDGTVDELCPSSDEVSWALNIKRGILSVFQNSMDDLRRGQKTSESDVNGNCEVEYSTENGHDGYVVRKTKNLLGCTERNDYSSSVQGIPYRVPSENQAIPLLNSEHNCQQEISSRGLLTSASCMESHTFRPFSREGSGAVTESKQSLNFVRESIPSATPGAISDRRGMTFEHAYGPDKSIRSQAELEEKLMDICRNTQQDIRPETPQFFSDLVYLMKTVDSQALRRVYQKLRTGSLCPNNIKRVRKFFLDAIPMAGTSSSLSMLTELINNDEITGVEADMWLTTLSFIQHPTKDMLREVMPLLSRNNGKAMLAVTSLVHNFCRKRTCDNDMEVRSIISTIEGKIEYGCNVDGDRLQKTIMRVSALLVTLVMLQVQFQRSTLV
ncbi:vitellogenin-like [Argopecten irradians]|uniref:vitellogenin-like n=1 Tax=Argopecten irradians TaxID=31199 RepID=UPI003722E69E